MHVAQIIGDFGQGGDGRVARNLATALAREGVRSTCIAVRSTASLREHPADTTLIDLGAKGGAVRCLRAFEGLRRFISREKVDLLHVHGQGCLPFTALALLGVWNRPKLWFTWHNSESVFEETGWKRQLLVWALRRCDHICGSSEQVVRRITAAGTFRVPVTVFRNQVPESAVTTGMDDDEPLLLWLGRLVPAKNPAMLIHAAAQLKRAGLKFRVVIAGSAPPGKEWFEKEMRALIENLELNEIISTPGWIGETQSLIGTAAIGVQTSETEGLSMTLLEQMMAGLAIVATNVGDTSQALDNGRCGLLIPSGDEAALVETLRKLITDRSFRRGLGAAAYEQALGHYSANAMARNAIAAYQESIREKKKYGTCKQAGFLR